jgi:transcriptional regulator with XRE-family HTH domain
MRMTKPLKTSPSRALTILRANLASLAEEKGWTSQAQIGKEIGIDQRNVGRILNMEVEPRLDTLSQIAEKLRVAEPVLLCEGMDARQATINPSIRQDILILINELIRLEKAGVLTEQAVRFLQDSLAIATGSNAGIAIKSKMAAQ